MSILKSLSQNLFESTDWEPVSIAKRVLCVDGQYAEGWLMKKKGPEGPIYRVATPEEAEEAAWQWAIR